MDYKEDLTTIHRKNIWSKFTKAIREFNLIEDGDRIAVCISGGKDSMLLGLLFYALKKYGIKNFDFVALCFDPGYTNETKDLILSNAKLLGIDLIMFKENIFDYISKLKTGSPCYLCARMRRGILYKKAQELGCNKIALGHHFDDVLQTTLMAVLYNGQFKTMMPKLHSTNFENMQLIRPLYFVREKDIINWKDKNGLNFINCACYFTRACETEDISTRRKMKKIIETLEKTDDLFLKNIYRSLTNVNLDTILGYFQNGQNHSFLEKFKNDNKKH